jgi:hypothetical protein
MLVLLCAAFTVWLLTTFEEIYFDITRGQTQAAILIAAGVGLFMNSGIAVAFRENSAWAFVVPLDHSTLAISARSAIGGATLARPASRSAGK